MTVKEAYDRYQNLLALSPTPLSDEDREALDEAWGDYYTLRGPLCHQPLRRHALEPWDDRIAFKRQGRKYQTTSGDPKPVKKRVQIGYL